MSGGDWRRWLVRSAVGLGWTGVGLAGLGLVARRVTLPYRWAIIMASFSPYLALLALPAAVLLAISRHRAAATAAAILLTGWLCAFPLPTLVATTTASGPPDLVVLQANLLLGEADAASIVDRVRSEHPDVVTFVELSPDEVRRLDAAGIGALLPYRYLAPEIEGAGSGIMSRFPLRSTVRESGFLLAVLVADVLIPGRPPARVFAVHLMPPWPTPASNWRREIGRLHGLLATAAASGQVVLVSGDFNATLDNAQFRRLLQPGYHDAARQAGSGIGPTYPTDRFFPPVLTLDHVLLRGAQALSTKTVSLPGSDHRGLVVRVKLTASR